MRLFAGFRATEMLRKRGSRIALVDASVHARRMQTTIGRNLNSQSLLVRRR